MKKRIFTVLLISVALFGCNDNDKIKDEIAKINVDLKISRFDKECARVGPDGIRTLKKKYPYLFPPQYSDSVWAAKLQDTIQIALFSEVDKIFPDFKAEKSDLDVLFRHIEYYFPRQRMPQVVTLTSDVDYANRIILADTLLLIGLDNYLGNDHRFYRDFPNYVAKDLDKKYLISDVASAFAKTVIPKPADRSFLAQMIYYGKELYLKDMLMPTHSDAQKIKYSENELAWAEVNEEPIWRNFVAQELLYSTDKKLAPRFLDPAPFSKFGLELDNESPGRIGRYMGWQIVRSFMDNNAISLAQMLPLPADEIFKKSNYKPKK